MIHERLPMGQYVNDYRCQSFYFSARSQIDAEAILEKVKQGALNQPDVAIPNTGIASCKSLAPDMPNSSPRRLRQLREQLRLTQACSQVARKYVAVTAEITRHSLLALGKAGINASSLFCGELSPARPV